MKMSLDNNDEIARMLGGKGKEEERPLPKKYGDKNTKIVEVEELKLDSASMEGMGKKLENIPPLLFLGIIAIIAAGFTPYKWLFMVGFLLIILAMFGKILTKEKKEKIKEKLKGWFKKK
jgi:Mg2+/citrate symporter